METMKGLQNTDTDRTNRRLKSIDGPEEKNKPERNNGMTETGGSGERVKICGSHVSVILKDVGYLVNHRWEQNNGPEDNHKPKVTHRTLIGRRLPTKHPSIILAGKCSFRFINLLKL